MTGDGMCGVFITDRGFQPQQILQTTATQTQAKETATQYTTVIPPALTLIHLPLPQSVMHLPTPIHSLTFPFAPPPACQNPVMYKYTTHPIPCHTSSTCL